MPPTGDPDVVRLLEEQAALRRVATLVARGTDRLGVFATVAEEVGRLLGADVTSMIAGSSAIPTRRALRWPARCRTRGGSGRAA